MKKIFLIILTLICLGNVLRAQSASKLKFYLSTGTIFPSGSNDYNNLSDSRNLGLSLSGGIGYSFSRVFTVMTEIDYMRFSYEDDQLAFGQNADANTIYDNSNLQSYIGIMSSLRISLFPDRSIAHPYIKIGTGAAYLTEVYGTYQPLPGGANAVSTFTSDDWGPVLTGGGGFRFKLSEYISLTTELSIQAWFAESGDSVQFAPLRIGLEF